MKTNHNDTECEISISTQCIDSLSFRKNKQLSIVSMSTGLLSIGDAAFSFCESMKKLCVPATVEHIGVAAFCCSGLEHVVFKGVPSDIENSIFVGCQHLKLIIVPRGSKNWFVAKLGIARELIKEEDADELVLPSPTEPIETTPIVSSFSRVKSDKLCRFNYNQQNYNWATGDIVALESFFSGPTTLYGNPSFQFRRKALFIFMKSDIANNILNQEIEYDIPANTGKFMRKYQEKYSNKIPRILLFICDDGKVASFYDEVTLIRANKNSITIKSLLRS